MAKEHNFEILDLSCLCRQVKVSFDVPRSKLPLRSHICHCSSCRHNSGQICITHTLAPPDSSPLRISGPLSTYISTPTSRRHFCSHCGSSVYDSDTEDPDIVFSPALLAKTEGIIEFERHVWAGAPKDGGARVWFPDLVAWAGGTNKSPKLPEVDYSSNKTVPSILSPTARLSAFCRCHGVKFFVTPPNEKSAKPVVAWSNLYEGSTAADDGGNPSDAKWWLRADNTKYLAGTCTCNSCRLASGFDFQAWAFVPQVNIFQLDGQPVDFQMGTLKTFKSSEAKYRDFCGTCGATVFWRSDKRPGLIDISVGLLDAESGARGEEWLDWKTDKVSFDEDAHNKAFIGDLGQGLKRWGEARDSSA